MITPITLTELREACRLHAVGVVHQRDQHAADDQRVSSKLYTSSISFGAWGQPGLRRSEGACALYQTFHSSRESMMRLGERRLAATASAIDATSLMKESEVLDHREIGWEIIRVVAEILM